MANRIILNNTSYHGKGAIAEIPAIAKTKGFTKTLIVTDPDLIKFNVATKVIDNLKAAGYDPIIFDQCKADAPSDVRALGGAKAEKQTRNPAGDCSAGCADLH